MSDATKERPVVAVDAMGGDFGSSAVVPGAVEALRDGGFRLALYGDEAVVAEQLSTLDVDGLDYEIVPCTQIIDMGESPAQAIRAKPDSPVVRALRDHKEGRVQAVFSAGSTGAMTAGGLMLLGRLPGVDRPAIATVIPTYEGRFLLLDAGANTQCTPEHLRTFALMGDVYAREILGVERPRVGLLNIGGEPGKGNELTVAAHALLAGTDLNFVGNVEGRGLLFGESDVVVTDGFTGNMTLKLIEGFGLFLLKAYKDSAAGADQASQGLGALLARMDYAATGGALMLGVQGSVIIGHGSSTARAVTSALKVAARLASRAVPSLLNRRLQDAS